MSFFKNLNCISYVVKFSSKTMLTVLFGERRRERRESTARFCLCDKRRLKKQKLLHICAVFVIYCADSWCLKRKSNCSGSRWTDFLFPHLVAYLYMCLIGTAIISQTKIHAVLRGCCGLRRGPECCLNVIRGVCNCLCVCRMFPSPRRHGFMLIYLFIKGGCFLENVEWDHQRTCDWTVEDPG